MTLAIEFGKICTDVQCGERFRDRLKLGSHTGDLTITDIRSTDAGVYKLQTISKRIDHKIFHVAVHGPSSGLIRGICAAVLVVLLVLGTVSCRFCHSRRNRSLEENVEDHCLSQKGPRGSFSVYVESELSSCGSAYTINLTNDDASPIPNPMPRILNTPLQGAHPRCRKHLVISEPSPGGATEHDAISELDRVSNPNGGVCPYHTLNLHQSPLPVCLSLPSPDSLHVALPQTPSKPPPSLPDFLCYGPRIHIL